jgi:SET and MYND domain-containing protein
MFATYAPAVTRWDIPGRGVGLVATRDIAPGECVLRERAIVCGTSASFLDSACARCLAFAAPDGGPLFTCATCGLAKLCGGDACAWSGSPHGKVACFAETLARGLPPADVERLRFLAACADLRGENTADASRRLASIHALCPVVSETGEGIEPRERIAAERLFPLLKRAVARAVAGTRTGPVDEASVAASADRIAGTVFETARLLAKESRNAFGAMAPRDSQTLERNVRGGALYDTASRVNHSCFPNTARFDNFDGMLDGDAFEAFADAVPASVADGFGGERKTKSPPDELRLIAVDAVPMGTEITMSYLPIDEPLASRRRRLRDTFGFECHCARCELEMRWAREDGDGVGDEGEDFGCPDDAARDRLAAEKDEDDQKKMASLSADDLKRRSERVPSEYAVFFLKNLCPDPECGGTLAPPNPRAAHMTCNACGSERTDERFYEQLSGEA